MISGNIPFSNAVAMSNRQKETDRRQQWQTKFDSLIEWMRLNSVHDDQDYAFIHAHYTLFTGETFKLYDLDYELPDGFKLSEQTRFSCEPAPQVDTHYRSGLVGVLSGGFTFTFSSQSKGETFTVTALCAFYDNEMSAIGVALVPKRYEHVWIEFARERSRISDSLPVSDKVIVIGGRMDSFVPSTNWDDVILDDDLKGKIRKDLDAFFATGVQSYKNLKLKPFRKILLAGVPGTGKTMICSAAAKTVIESGGCVVYVSSADAYGSTFGKVVDAMNILANSRRPSLLIVEELDVYVHDEREKSIVLNVLDGNETPINPYGVFMIATTNYPEAIDERIFKRPGRIDRMYIIPELKSDANAEKVLRRYLGEMWQDDHAPLARKLVGYTPAFVREVVVSALTLAAYQGGDTVSPDMLRESLETLKDQIDLRDDFLSQPVRSSMGFTPLAMP